MKKLRKILNNSFVGKFFVHVFILNFFTCQCLATIPQDVIAESFRSNLDALFREFDESREKLSLSLNRIGSAQFELKITKTDLYARQEEKEFTGSVQTDTDGTEFVQFRLAKNVDPVTFYLYNKVCNLSYLDSKISLFETKDRLRIDDLRTSSMPR